MKRFSDLVKESMNLEPFRDGIISLSPTGDAVYRNCGLSYLLSRILRIRSTSTSVNLIFGDAFSTTMEAFFKGRHRGYEADLESVFKVRWESECERYEVRCGKKIHFDDYIEIGLRLARQIPDSWDKTGLSIMVDADGDPVVERQLDVMIAEDVRLITKLDVGAVNQNGEGVVLDSKTPAKASSAVFSLLGDQLTAYQLMLTVHREEMGTPLVAQLGYWEFLKKAIPKTKRGTGPIALDPHLGPARGRMALTRYVEKLQDTAESIRRGSFHASPRMAYNTPCDGCDFNLLCSSSKCDGLTFRSGEHRELALKLVA